MRELYRRAGYREAQVGVGVTTDPACGDAPRSCALDNAALTAAFVETGVGDDLYVRFTIVPGERTLLERVVIDGGDDDAKEQLAGPLCDPLIHELATEANIAGLRRESAATCTAREPAAIRLCTLLRFSSSMALAARQPQCSLHSPASLNGHARSYRPAVADALRVRSV